MPKKKIRLGVYLFMTLFFMILIFVFSSQDADKSKALSDGLLFRLLSLIHMTELMDEYGGMIRKLAHFGLYFALGTSSLLTLYELRPNFSPEKSAWLFSTIYAVSDEIHQFFVPGRAMQLSDVLLDSAGAFTAILIISAIRMIAFNYREESKKYEQTPSPEKE